MNRRRKLMIATVGVATVLAGAATTTALAASPTPGPQTTTSTPAPTGTPASPAPTSTATPTDDGGAADRQACEAAVAVAQKRVPGGQVTEVERETEHGQAVCQVELREGQWEHELDIAVNGNAVVKAEREQDDDQDDGDDRDDTDDDMDDDGDDD